MLERFFPKKAEFEIVAMDVDHCRPASVIHGERFSRAWSDGEFLELIRQDTTAGFVARQVDVAPQDSVTGFVLARAAAGEGEILSIGVAQRCGRLGLGWRLMRAALQELHARDAESVFLEVDETNVAALALYRGLGFAKVAERPAYYIGSDGRRTAAHVMRLDLTRSRLERGLKR